MEIIERRIKEIRSKELQQDGITPVWKFYDNTVGNVYEYKDNIQPYETMVILQKETKRGFTISYKMAGVWLELFISRSNCVVVYDLD